MDRLRASLATVIGALPPGQQTLELGGALNATPHAWQENMRAQIASQERQTAASDRLTRATEALNQSIRQHQSTIRGVLPTAALSSGQEDALARVVERSTAAMVARLAPNPSAGALGFTPGGTAYLDTATEGPAYRALTNLNVRMTELSNEIARIARAATPSTRNELIHAVQQANAAEIHRRLQDSSQAGSSLLGQDYNGTLAGIGAYIGGPRVTSKQKYYDLLTHGRISAGEADVLGSDAQRLLDIDPQSGGRGERYRYSYSLHSVAQVDAGAAGPLDPQASAAIRALNQDLSTLESIAARIAPQLGVGVRGLIDRPNASFGNRQVTAEEIRAAAAGYRDPVELTRARMLAQYAGTTYPTDRLPRYGPHIAAVSPAMWLEPGEGGTFAPSGDNGIRQILPGLTQLPAVVEQAMRNVLIRDAISTGTLVPKVFPQAEALNQTLSRVFHGTGGELPGTLLPRQEVSAFNGQMYGPGMYATSSQNIAGTYGDRLYQLNAGRQRVFDLDQPISDAHAEGLRQAFSAYGLGHKEDPFIGQDLPLPGTAMLDTFNRLLEEGTRIVRLRTLPTGPNRDLNNREPLTYQQLYERLGGFHGVDQAKAITDYLERATGATALRYQGGSFTGGERHDAYVVLRPESLRVLGDTITRAFSTAHLPQYSFQPRPIDSARLQQQLGQYSGAAIDRTGLLSLGAGSTAASARIAASRQAQQQAEEEQQRAEAARIAQMTFTSRRLMANVNRFTSGVEHYAEQGAISRGPIPPYSLNLLQQPSAASGQYYYHPGPHGPFQAPNPFIDTLRSGFTSYLQAPTYPAGYQRFIAGTGGVLGRYSQSREVGPYLAGHIPGEGSTLGLKVEEARASAQAAHELEALAAAVREAEAALRTLQQSTPGLAGASRLVAAGVPISQLASVGFAGERKGFSGFGNVSPDQLTAYAAAQDRVKIAQQAFTTAQSQAAQQTAASTRVINDAVGGPGKALVHVPGLGTASYGAGPYAYPYSAGSGFRSFGYPSGAPGSVPPGQPYADTLRASYLGGRGYAGPPLPPYGGGTGFTSQGGFIPPGRSGGYGFTGYGGGIPPRGPTPVPGAGAGGDGYGSGFFGDFQRGFRGNPDVPVASQLGQTARFSVYYGLMYKALFAIVQTFQAALQEAIEFQTALTELKLATGRSGSEADDLAQQLGQQAAAAGFAPAEGVLAGARAIGLYGLTEAPQAAQDFAAIQSARVTGQLALGSGLTFQEIQAQTAAVTNAYGLGIQGTSYVGDLDAYLTRKFGVAPGSTLQPVSQTAALGKAAGFSLEEQTAIAAEVQARLGVDGGLAGGLLSQIFSRTGSDFGAIGQRFGVDTSGDLRSVLINLSRYSRAHPEAQTDIASSFGRGRSQGLAQVLLQDLPDILRRGRQAETQAPGTLDEQFQARLNNIGGQLALLGGAFKEFALQLGSTGMIDTLGLVVKGLTGLLGAANGVLEIFNLIPRPVRDTIFALGLLALAFRANAASVFLGGAAGKAAGFASAAVAGTGGSALAAGAAGAGAAGFALLANPITYAIAGLLAVGSLVHSARALDNAIAQATQARIQFGADFPIAGSASPEQYRAQASTLKSQAEAVRKSPGFVGNIFSFGTLQHDANVEATNLEQEARYYSKLSKQRFVQNASASQQFAFDSQSISDAFTTISNRGGTATDQMRLLARAIDRVGGAGGSAVDRLNFHRGQFAQEAVSPLDAAVQSALNTLPKGGLLTSAYISGPGGGASQLRVFADNFIKQVEGTTGLNNLQDIIKERFKSVSSPNQLYGAKFDNIAEGITSDVADLVIAPYKDVLSDNQEQDIHDRIDKYVRRFLRDQRAGYAVAHPKGQFSQESGALAADNAFNLTQERLGLYDANDVPHRTAALRLGITRIQRIIRHTPDNLPRAANQLNKLYDLYAQTKVDDLEALRRAQQQDAKSGAERRAIGQRILRQELRIAVDSGSASQVIRILSQAGDGAIGVVRQMLRGLQRIVDAAHAEYARVLALSGTQYVDGELVGHGLTPGYVPTPQDRRVERNIKVIGRAIRVALSAIPGTSNYGAHPNDANLADGGGASDTAAQIAAARAAAEAARQGGELAGARAAIQSAQADLAAAKPGTVAYYQALAGLYQAQISYADTVRNYQHILNSLAIDLTNPLKVANLALREARQKLAQDLAAGRGADVIAQDRLDVRNAETEAEQTRFQQRLERAQTADNLGRISHQAYLRYLDHEKERLESIKHRTFQQQQELDQIDGLIKDAASSMDSQFNLGNIHLPTPYEVRRFIQQSAHGAVAAAGAQAVNAVSTSTTTINIDGADVAMVKKVVRETLGEDGTRRNGVTRRKASVR